MLLNGCRVTVTLQFRLLLLLPGAHYLCCCAWQTCAAAGYAPVASAATEPATEQQKLW
jgi:hypothetical protein